MAFIYAAAVFVRITDFDPQLILALVGSLAIVAVLAVGLFFLLTRNKSDRMDE